MQTMVLIRVGLPIGGTALIWGVDRLMDMIRTVVNITGDTVVTSTIAKSKGNIDMAVYKDPDADVPMLHLGTDPAAEAHLAEIAHHGQSDR